MKSSLLLSFLSFLCISINAQETFQINGTISDENQEPLIGATVYLLETYVGSSTNFNGNYHIANVSPGQYTLITSVIGFKSDTLIIEVKQQDLQLNRMLQPQAVALQAVEIVSERITERTSISNISFQRAALETSHGLTEDPVRTLATLPGVGRGGDLFSPSQIYVRGGAPDENLFLMDNNKLYFPYYFGGQKSIFNTDAIESVELLTGGFSAAYGNHMSSVLNVQTRDGDFNNYKGMLSFGFYNSAGLFEGPIIKEKLSVLIAVRRTYLDLLLDESAEFPVPSFGDITYKASYKINQNHKLSMSGLSSDESINYLAGDPQPGFANKLETQGNNHFQSLQLKSTNRTRYYNKLSTTYSSSRNTSEIGTNFMLNIDAYQVGVRDDFTYYLSNKHKLKTGLEWQYGGINFEGNLPLDPHQTDPNDTTIILRNLDINEEGEVIRSAYILYDGNPIRRVGINTGIRLDQNPDNDEIDISPRFAINYQVTEKSKARFSTGIYRQFANAQDTTLASNEAIHYILGYEYRFTHSLYGWIEAYYKDYNHLTHYDSLLNYSNNGEGLARGIELFLRKERGNLRGWVSYAYSRSERKAPLLDEIVDFEFDQRHIINVVAEYHIPKKESAWYIPSLIQINYRYADGTPYTPVVGARNDGTGWRAIQGDPLSQRNSDYQNLNLRIEWKYKLGKKVRATSFMEGWNVLNNENILGRSYQYGTQYDNNVREQPFYTTPFLFAGGFKVSFGNP